MLSIVIPAFNEEKNVPFIYKELCLVLDKEKLDFEIIYVDDGSKDNTWREISNISKKDKRVKGILFTRNFGHQMALTAGLREVKGDYIVTMDCDMQDPPEVILKMLEKSKEKKVEIVYAKRLIRDDGFLKKLTANLYYRILHGSANFYIPRNVGDFRLMTKKVVDVINSCGENARYIRGLVAWTGFSYAFVDFKRPNRKFGETNYTWSKMFQLGFDGFTGFTNLPLMLAKYLAIFGFFISVVLVLFLGANFFFHFLEIPYWVIILFCIFILSSFQFIVLWLLGEYIGRMYTEDKKRPLYIVEENLNIMAEK